ncbi:MAG: tetratricopeptide repeat protein [Candidatus Heimdallarchaeota archaeon]|nr:MAG: tetratricopeptide repeat protein [Candidatus Heimdallarchaeota archaeon]
MVGWKQYFKICGTIFGIILFLQFLGLGIFFSVLGDPITGPILISISFIPIIIFISLGIRNWVKTRKEIKPKQVRIQRPKPERLTQEEAHKYITGARAKRPSTSPKPDVKIGIRTISSEVKQWVLTPEKGLSLESETDLGKREEAFQLNEIGLGLQQQGKKEQAEEYFQKAIELYPEFAIAYGNLGGLYVLTGNFNEAVRYYLKAISLDNSNISFHTGIAAAYTYTRQFEKAERELAIAEEINPDNMAFIMNKGSLLYTSQKHKESAEYHEKILSSGKIQATDYQRQAMCNYRLAYAYANLKKAQKAIEIADEFLEKSYIKANKQLMAMFIQTKVKALQSKKKYNSAIELLKEKLILDPANLIYLTELADTLQMAKKYQEAISIYEKVLPYHPNPTQIQRIIVHLESQL